MERLHKYMARAGVASRRKSEELISEGKVLVNGKLVTLPGLKIDPYRDRVEVEGQLLRRPEKKVYLLLYKPVGYVTTVKDPHGRRKVTDLLHGIKQRVYPVGRLDYDTEGLLLLTNDGSLTYALTHPSHEVRKTYLGLVEGVPEQSKIDQLQKGVVLKDGPTAPAEVRLISSKRNNGLLEITIHEGRSRQVRRMCEYIGHPVISLKRTSIGPLRLGDLKPGQYRHLTTKEVHLLRKLTNN